MTTKETPEAILWRGLKFEPTSSGESGWRNYIARIDGQRLLLSYSDERPLRWSAWLTDDGAGYGANPEEALEAARSQVESIARAVGLIPDVEAQRLLDAVVAWREYDETHEPGDPGFTTAPFCRFDMALRDYRKTLAAKLGKGER